MVQYTTGGQSNEPDGYPVAYRYYMLYYVCLVICCKVNKYDYDDDDDDDAQRLCRLLWGYMIARYMTRQCSYIFKVWWGFNNRIKKGLLLGVRVIKFLKSMNIWQSNKQDRGCLMPFARLANTLLKDEESRPTSVVDNTNNILSYRWPV